MPRLTRIACVIASLALPALGVALADTVHRAGAPEATQAAAPVSPLDGAAAPAGAAPPTLAARQAPSVASGPGNGEARS